MYLKQINSVLQKLFLIISALFGRMGTRPKKIKGAPVLPVEYSFRPFVYEEVKPTHNTKCPFPRSGHRICADSANFYSFGGYNPLSRTDEEHVEENEEWVQSYPLFQELWKFNFATKTWFRYPNSNTLPLELASNAMVLHGNILMVYGGTGSPFGFRCSNQLYLCKVTDNTGQMVEISTSGNLPLPLYGQAVIFDSGALYTIGGTTGLSYTCDIHKLNMKTTEWEALFLCKGQIGYEPEGRYRHEVGYDGKFIYVLGGGTADVVYDFNEIPAFSLEKLEWVAKKTIRDPNKGTPSSRRCHGAVQIKESQGLQVFITGGHDGENVFDDLWRLDLATMAWTCFEMCVLPKPMYFHAASATPEGKLFVFGGIFSDDDSFVRTNSVYSTWLCIPKLSEISWEAVVTYFPKFVQETPSDELINIGLPKRFVNRLPVAVNN